LTADPHLLFAMAANEVWEFEATLMVTAPNTSADFKFGWVLPSGATMLWGVVSGLVGTDDSWDSFTTGGSPRDLLIESDVLARGSTGSAGVYPVHLKGVVTNGANAGDCVLSWAQNTSDGGNSTLKINSFIKHSLLNP